MGLLFPLTFRRFWINPHTPLLITSHLGSDVEDLLFAKSYPASLEQISCRGVCSVLYWVFRNSWIWFLFSIWSACAYSTSDMFSTECSLDFAHIYFSKYILLLKCFVFFLNRKPLLRETFWVVCVWVCMCVPACALLCFVCVEAGGITHRTQSLIGLELTMELARKSQKSSCFRLSDTEITSIYTIPRHFKVGSWALNSGPRNCKANKHVSSWTDPQPPHSDCKVFVTLPVSCHFSIHWATLKHIAGWSHVGAVCQRLPKSSSWLLSLRPPSTHLPIQPIKLSNRPLSSLKGCGGYTKHLYASSS